MAVNACEVNCFNIRVSLATLTLYTTKAGAPLYSIILQQSAYMLYLPSMRFLLDAGVDTRLPFQLPPDPRRDSTPAGGEQVDGVGAAFLDTTAAAAGIVVAATESVMPLQIVCAIGRGLYALLDEPVDAFLSLRKARAMEICVELLKWHTAYGDGL